MKKNCYFDRLSPTISPMVSTINTSCGQNLFQRQYNILSLGSARKISHQMLVEYGGSNAKLIMEMKKVETHWFMSGQISGVVGAHVFLFSGL